MAQNNQVMVVQDENRMDLVLQESAPRIAKMLPAGISLERTISIFRKAALTTPRIFQCTEISLVNAISESVELGLPVGGTQGLAYLIPYKQNDRRSPYCGMFEAHLMPSYKGLIQLARRSGELSQLDAQIVCENDVFDIKFGSEPKVVHEPEYIDERGKPIGCYAIARMKGDEFPTPEWMTEKEINVIRKSAQSPDSPAWKYHTGQMWRKTLLKRVLTRMPFSTENTKLQAAINADNVAAGFNFEMVSDVKRESGVNATKERIAANGPKTKQRELTSEGSEVPPRSEDDTFSPLSDNTNDDDLPFI